MPLHTWLFDGTADGTELTTGNVNKRLGSISLGSPFRSDEGYPRVVMDRPLNAKFEVVVSWFKFPEETKPIVILRDRNGDALDYVSISPEGYLSFRDVQHPVPVPLGMHAKIVLDLAKGEMDWAEDKPKPLRPPTTWPGDDCEHDWQSDGHYYVWTCAKCGTETWATA